MWRVVTVLVVLALPSTAFAEDDAQRRAREELEKQLAEYLGTRVKLQLGRKKGSGRLVLDFYTLDQFDGLMQKIGFGGR